MIEATRAALDDADRALIAAAERARERAHAPYSGFRVGAAVRGEGGRVVSGCNVENATFGLTLCAERVAVFAAIAEGLASLEALAVVVAPDQPALPCGICREMLREFAPAVRVILSGRGDAVRVASVGELIAGSPDASTGESGGGRSS